MIKIDLSNLTDREQIERFHDWLITKPAKETYDYCDPAACCFAQYLRQTGVTPTPNVVPYYWDDGRPGRMREIPLIIEESIQTFTDADPNFGMVLERLEEEMERAYG